MFAIGVAVADIVRETARHQPRTPAQRPRDLHLQDNRSLGPLSKLVRGHSRSLRYNGYSHHKVEEVLSPHLSASTAVSQVISNVIAKALVVKADP